MIETELRALIAADYRFGDTEYSVVRSKLERKAWSVGRAAMHLGYYVNFYTFPRWTSNEGMLAFAPVFGEFDLTSDSCMCLQVNSSPISDWISTDASVFSAEEATSHRLSALISGLLSDQELSSLFLWIGECVDLPLPIHIGRTDVIRQMHNWLNNPMHEDFAAYIGGDA